MSLGDWTQAGSGLTVSIEINTPLVGDGSLKFAASAAVNQKNMYLTNLDKGFTKGRIRSLMRMVVRPTTQAYARAGLICMQSVINPAAATGAYYTFGWGVGSSTAGTPGTQKWLLMKRAPSGQLSSVGTELNSTSVVVSASDYYPVQLEWVVDIADLGGTRLTASVGTLNSTDFGTLVTVFDYLDTSSPLTTSVAEGIFCTSANAAGAETYTYTFDETTIYQLV